MFPTVEVFTAKNKHIKSFISQSACLQTSVTAASTDLQGTMKLY